MPSGLDETLQDFGQDFQWESSRHMRNFGIELPEHYYCTSYTFNEALALEPQARSYPRVEDPTIEPEFGSNFPKQLEKLCTPSFVIQAYTGRQQAAVFLAPDAIGIPLASFGLVAACSFPAFSRPAVEKSSRPRPKRKATAENSNLAMSCSPCGQSKLRLSYIYSSMR